MKSDFNKTIVITGASGFLGCNLLTALKGNNKFYVYALTSHSNELQYLNTCRNIEYCHKDIVFSDEGKHLLEEAMLVNCAFPRNYNGVEIADGLRYIQRLFNLSKECGVKTIVNISSQSVYSRKREEAATEETSVCLDNSYAVGKYATELMLESICNHTEITYTNLRMASLIGPGFNQRIVNRFVKQALEGKPIKVKRNNQRFGFLDVNDAVRAIILLLNSPVSVWKPIYNVGNNKGYSTEEIITCLNEVFDSFSLSFPDLVYEEDDESGSTMLSYSLLNKDIGYEPIIDLRNSMIRILEWYQNNEVAKR